MAARERTTQKAIVIDALTAYFSQKQENLALARLAKVVTVERSLIRKKLGRVDDRDRQAIRSGKSSRNCFDVS
jgi:hypothetical protein